MRPAVAQDGGDITFRGYENGTVFLHMKGACAGCPSSTATLKHGIQNLLKHFVPEVQHVEQVAKRQLPPLEGRVAAKRPGGVASPANGTKRNFEPWRNDGELLRATLPSSGGTSSTNPRNKKSRAFAPGLLLATSCCPDGSLTKR